MAYKVDKVVLNKGEVSKQLLKGAGTKQVLRAVASRVAGQAGIGTETNEYDGVNRTNIRVSPATWEDFRENLENNNLLKALY